jgi:O-antigen ligase
MISYFLNPFVLLAAVSAVLFSVLVGRWALRKPRVFLRYAFLLAFLLATLWASLMPRSTELSSLDYLHAGKEVWQVVMNVQEVLALLVIGFVLLAALSGKVRATKDVRMLTMVLVLFAMTAVIGTALTPDADWSRGLLIPTAFLVAMLLHGSSSVEAYSRYVIFGLVVVVFGSLLAFIIAPDWALSGRGDGLFNLDGRLLGLTTHPNALGYLAVFLVVLTWWTVTSSRSALIIIGVSLAVLVLTVSRTAWIAAIVAASIWAAFRFFPKLTPAARIQTSVLILGFGVAAVIAGVSFGFIDSGDRVFVGATTLTGRTEVWYLSWELWKESPLFGYGTAAWSEEWRGRFGLSWAGQAHNQIFQTLVQSGLVGAVVLIIYLVILIRLALAKAEISNGASIALVAVLLIRGITEAPLRSFILDQMFFAHLIVLLMLLFPEKGGGKRRMNVGVVGPVFMSKGSLLQPNAEARGQATRHTRI